MSPHTSSSALHEREATATAVAQLSSDEQDPATVLRELAWVVHRCAPDRAGGPIPTTEVALLKQVNDAPGSTVGELAASLGLRQPNVSSALRSLERRGLVRRNKADDDQRVTRISLTTDGAAEHAALSEAWKAPLLDAFAELDSEQRELFAAAMPVLRRLHDTLRGQL